MGTAKVQGELWGVAAADWATLQEPKHIPLFNAMLDAANVRAGATVLDAGCGGGGACLLAHERGAKETGLDASAEMIAFARERVPSGYFRVGDIEELPYEDGVFDAILAPNSIQYTADRVAALRELGRVCAPQGRIVVGLFSAPDKVEFRHIFKAVRDVMPEPPSGDGPFGLSGPGILEGLMADAGLNVVETSEVDCPFAYPDFETFWRASASAGPFQNVLHAVGEDRVRAALRDAVKGYRNGRAGFEIAPNMFKYAVATL